MASLLSKLTAGQLWELNSVMARNITAEEALKLLNNPGVWEQMVVAMRGDPVFLLAHGVWRSSKDVLEEENDRLKKAGHDLDQFTWVGSSEPPERTEDMERDEAWALETSLATLGVTFELYASWLLEAHEVNLRWPELKSDSDHMKLIEGQCFQPMTRRWRRVKLNAKLGASPQDVETSEAAEDIAGIDALAALAQNPERLRKMDGQQWCFVNFTALRICAAGYGGWALSPYVYRYLHNGGVDLYADKIKDRSSGWSCPLRRRPRESKD